MIGTKEKSKKWTDREKAMGVGLAVLGIGAVIMAYLITRPKQIIVDAGFYPPSHEVKFVSTNCLGNNLGTVVKQYSKDPVSGNYLSQTDIPYPLLRNGNIIVKLTERND